MCLGIMLCLMVHDGLPHRRLPNPHDSINAAGGRYAMQVRWYAHTEC